MSNIFLPLNLKKHANHKLVYDSLPINEKGFGLDQLCVLTKNFSCTNGTEINGVNFEFMLGDFDNIYCENQEIEVNMRAKKINILGFSYWGDNYDFLKIICEDGSMEYLKLVLLDWTHTIRNAPAYFQNELLNCEVKTGEIYLSTGWTVHMVHLHHFSYCFNGDKIISSIILPDNMFMHIFAITLEG